MLDLTGPELNDAERMLLRRPQVGGVIIFARNVVSREQVCELNAAIGELRPELLLAVDQEGGRVQRLLEGYTRLPSMQALADLYVKDPEPGGELLRDTGWLMAAEVIASGFDFSFAPVLDVDRSHCTVIANRSFGDDPVLVSEAASLFIAGMHEAGMAATGKHFPGHGGVSGDSHLETPVDGRDLDTLRAHDLIPFKALIGDLQGLMPAHIIYPAVDAEGVCFSRYWLHDVLRDEFGFKGVVFSDDLSMKGADVVGSYTDKAIIALEAGCDMVLVCNNRAGALEVLDMLSERGLGVNTEGLTAMKAARNWTWTELERDARRQATVDKIARLL